MSHKLTREEQTELEAASFRRLLNHLDDNKDVQNIDLMILAGFCRNCLSKWYKDEADTRGIELSDSDARELIYGMPYDVWKKNHQADATPEQLAKMQQRQSKKQSQQ